MTTAARTNTEGSARFYTRTGEPCFEIPKKKGDGTRKPTIKDAREMGLVPSVTSILKVLDKPQLNAWKIEQACLAVLTSPRKDGEDVDSFVHRILHVEEVQDEEARKARDLGSAIHDALAMALAGDLYDPDLEPYVKPVVMWRMGVGSLAWTEKVVVGDGYAGRADALLDNDTLGVLVLADFKTTGTMPKESYLDHRLQTSAYAAALGNTGGKRIVTCNVYISTKQPGQFIVHSQDDWAETYVKGFEPILNYWKFANGMADL